MAKILILLVLALVALSALSEPQSDESGETVRGARKHGKRCMGTGSKPSLAKKRADKDCQKIYSVKLCIRLCRLEKLKVIMNSQINTKALRSYIGQSYPTIAQEELSARFLECSPKYTAGTNASSSQDCAENKEFIDCTRAAVEEVCSRPSPN